MKYRPDIDALRAVAVSAVVLSHLGIAGFSGGFSGVDIFFVISGFLITNFLLQRASSGQISLGEFYFRRARRILPMALLVLVLTCLAAIVLFSQLKAVQVATDSYWAALFLANLHLIQQSADYFNHGFEQSAVQHYWSLAVEEQFYLIFPLLVIAVVAVAKRLGLLSWQKTLTWLIAAGASISLIWAILQGSTEPAVAYFSSATRAYELAMGALLAALAFGKEAQTRVRRSTIASFFAVVMFVASFVALNESLSFPSYFALLPTLGAAVFIWADVSRNKVPVLSRVFTSKPIVYVGKISFSVYLIHWPVLVFVKALLPELATSWMFAPVVLATTLALSALGYRFVETPIRKIELPGRNRSSKQRLVIVGAATLAFLGLASSALAMTGGTLNTAHLFADAGPKTPDKYKPNVPGEASSPTPSEPSAVEPTATPSPTGSETAAPTATPTSSPSATPTVKPTEPPKPPAEPKLAALLSKWMPKVSEGLNLTTVPDDLDPPIAALLSQRGAQWAQCMDPSYHQPTCTFGSAFAKHTAVILGDSYALAIYPMVIEALGLSDWRIVGLNQRECMVSDIVPWSWSDSGADTDCPDHRAWANDYVKKNKPDLVILSDQAIHPIADGNKRADDNHDALWENGLDSALSKLSKISKSIVYFGLPTSQQGLVDCVQAGNKLSDRCTGHSGWLAHYVQTQYELSSKYDIRFIDANDWTCLNGSCPSIIDNTPVYWDGAHFTQTFAGKMGPLFRAYLLENGLLK